MCLIFFALDAHPRYKFIFAGNRDEFYNRPTQQAHYWLEHPDILGGRDLQAGGTWLAIRKNGRLGFVTNYRDPDNINPKARSRGHLAIDYILSEKSTSEYIQSIERDRYNGFNLVVGDSSGLHYLSNYAAKTQTLTSGVFGLSNHLLDTPWPKVIKGKEKFTNIIDSESLSPWLLLDMLYDDEPAPRDHLPNTGVGLDWEEKLSPMFIKTLEYGSRCSTVLMIDRNDNALFVERTYRPETFEFETRSFQITLGL